MFCLLQYGKNKSIRDEIREEKSTQTEEIQIEDKAACKDQTNYKASKTTQSQENKLKNTFGWARIDVIVMLICCVFLLSLSFSLLVEALQTLVHIDHFHEMHNPLTVFIVGCVGLILNGICYLLIGGVFSQSFRDGLLLNFVSVRFHVPPGQFFVRYRERGRRLGQSRNVRVGEERREKTV